MEPHGVSPLYMARMYRDDQASAINQFSDREVCIDLPPASYVVRGEDVHWYTGMNGAKPVIIFVGARRLIHGGTPRIKICGHCEGAKYDADHRGSDFYFTIRIVDCSVPKR